MPFVKRVVIVGLSRMGRPSKDPRAIAFEELLANNLWLARHARHLTQKEAGLKAGVESNQVAQWETRGKRITSVGLLKILVDAYQYPLDWMFEEHPRF